MRHGQRPTLSDRLELRFSNGRQVDGLWVGVSLDSEPEPVVHRVEEALGLIKTYDRRQYDRLAQDLDRVWVRDLPGALGKFNASLRACELDRRFVLAETSPPDLIAATIVHEVAHARLHRCGIGYEEALRPRIERVCFRRELAFAAKLPNGERVREQVEGQLVLCTTEGFWTNAAFAQRYEEDHVQALHDLGAPAWLAQAVLRLRRLRLRAGVFAKGVRRLIQWR
jgi:hypothetical protein